MNIQSINNIEILNNILLTNIELINNNYYKSSFYLNNNEDIIFEFPKCNIKSLENMKDNIMDLVYDNSINSLNVWIKNLEEILCNKIYEKNEIWFTNSIEKKSINNMITPLYRNFNGKKIIRTYINVDKNMNNIERILHNNLDKIEIIPIIKLDYLIINSNSFDIKLNVVELNIKDNLIKEVDLVINDNNIPLKLKKHNEVYIKYYNNTILKARNLQNETIKKYLEAINIKSKIYNLSKEFVLDENKEIENLNEIVDEIINDNK